MNEPSVNYSLLQQERGVVHNNKFHTFNVEVKTENEVKNILYEWQHQSEPAEFQKFCRKYIFIINQLEF
jgi:ribosomal protein L21E